MAHRSRAGALALSVGAVMLSIASTPITAHALVTTPLAFQNYPVAVGNTTYSAGEPSIGVNWQSGAVMVQSSTHVIQAKFDDSAAPATVTMKDVTPVQSATTLDPILFTDHFTGSAPNRTFSSNLLVACSLTTYTDTDGVPASTAWTPSQGCGVHGAEDHQSLGSGPYHAAVTKPPVNPAFPNAVYYCSQDFANGTAAFCSRSDDGALTYDNPVDIYTLQQCGGLHGHIRVAPDGTAYVPNQGCIPTAATAGSTSPVYTKQTAVTSVDNGLTWTLNPVPDSRATAWSDPSVAPGAQNTVYFGYENGGVDASNVPSPTAAGGHPMIAVYHPVGSPGAGASPHWDASVDVGTPFNIQNTAFPEVIAGDDNRAAFAFLGTTTPGNDQDAAFAGVWYLYVSFTYDGGKTWTTVNATPGDPVQRGCIWLAGGSNACRNLLDFNDIAVDKLGRVVVVYADGCTGPCVTDPSKNKFEAVNVIARQSGGLGLFAASDPGNSAFVPETPSVAGLVLVVGAALVIYDRRRRWFRRD